LFFPPYLVIGRDAQMQAYASDLTSSLVELISVIWNSPQHDRIWIPAGTGFDISADAEITVELISVIWNSPQHDRIFARMLSHTSGRVV